MNLRPPRQSTDICRSGRDRGRHARRHRYDQGGLAGRGDPVTSSSSSLRPDLRILHLAASIGATAVV
jgi:hypothetical protein